MEKSNYFLRNIAKVVEAGLISSRDLKKEVENASGNVKPIYRKLMWEQKRLQKPASINHQGGLHVL